MKMCVPTVILSILAKIIIYILSFSNYVYLGDVIINRILVYRVNMLWWNYIALFADVRILIIKLYTFLLFTLFINVTLL